MKLFYNKFVIDRLGRKHVSPLGKCKKITYFAIKNLIQDSKESRGRQMVKENNIIFTLER
jgi:hypothetical protein